MPTVAVQPHPRTASRGLLPQALQARVAAPCLPAACDNTCVCRSRVESSYHCLCRIQAALRSAAIWIGRSWDKVCAAFSRISRLVVYQSQGMTERIGGSIHARCTGMRKNCDQHLGAAASASRALQSEPSHVDAYMASDEGRPVPDSL
jgi:hypothetical protein